MEINRYAIREKDTGLFLMNGQLIQWGHKAQLFPTIQGARSAVSRHGYRRLEPGQAEIVSVSFIIGSFIPVYPKLEM